MEFVTVNYKSNKEYFIEKCVLKDLVLNKLKSVKEIKVKDVAVNICKNCISFEIQLSSLKGDLSKTLLELQEMIDFEVLSLTNSKPQNINISIDEVKNG